MKALKISLIILILSPNINAQSWYPMGNIDALPSFNGRRVVQGITSFNNSLIIGGSFKKEGTTILNGVGKWGWNNWQSMGLGTWALQSVDSGANGGRGLITYHNTLYCGGGFSGAGGSYIDEPSHHANNIARWVSNDWNPLSQPMSGFNNGVAASCVYKNNLYIGGPFGFSNDYTGAHYTLGLSKWNDTVFSNVGNFTGPVDDFVGSFTIFNDKLIAGGLYEQIDGMPGFNNIATYNDTAWSAMGNGFDWGVMALAIYNGELYAAGCFEASNDYTTPLNKVAKWTGSTWVQVGEGLGLSTDGYKDSVLALCVDSVNNKLYAGGTFTQTGLGVPARHLAEWNGTNWVEVGGGTDDFVWALFAKNGNLYVGGEFTHVGAGIAANLIACWGSNPNEINETVNNNETYIFPNPSNGSFTIHSEGMKIKSITVTNLLGEQIKTITNSETIDLTEQPKGIYFVEIQTEKGTTRKKIIKQ